MPKLEIEVDATEMATLWAMCADAEVEDVPALLRKLEGDYIVCTTPPTAEETAQARAAARAQARARKWSDDFLTR